MKHLLLLASLLVVGCKTTKEYVTVPVVRTDTMYVAKTERDSVWVHDSVFHTIHAKGDTVFSVVHKWHTQYRDRVRVDTIRETRVDSVPYPVEVVKEVERKLTWWQRTRLHIANLLLLVLVVLCGWGVLRLWLKIKI